MNQGNIILMLSNTLTLYSQIISIIIEPYITESDQEIVFPPDDYTTYRLYAVLTHPNDFVSAIGGDATNPLYINTTGEFWHDSSQNNLVTYSEDISSVDSWITIDGPNNTNGTSPFFAGNEDSIINTFSNGGNIELSITNHI